MGPVGARQGKSATPQDEVIRIAGRVCYEIYNNGGVNLRALVYGATRAVCGHPSPGLPMPSSFVARAEGTDTSLKRRSMSHQAVDDITEVAVEWVRLNPVLVE